MLKKVLDVKAILGMLAGALVMLSGSEQQKKDAQNTEESGEELQKGTQTMIFGAVVMLISYVSLYKYVPDTDANKINTAYNERITSQWERSVAKTMDLNRRIINTCMWRVSTR